MRLPPRSSTCRSLAFLIVLVSLAQAHPVHFKTELLRSGNPLLDLVRHSVDGVPATSLDDTWSALREIGALPSSAQRKASKAAKEATSSDDCGHTPVVIIPSLIGNQIDARLVNKPKAHWWCQSNSKFFRLWIPADIEFYPEIVKCWFSDITLQHPARGKYEPTEGVEIRIPDWGIVDSVTSLNGNVSQTPVWYFITQMLIKHHGYVDGKDLVAAPVDWRWGPDAYEPIFENLQQLIENVSRTCGNRKVALLTLSWGAPFTNLFLTQHVSQAWKELFVEMFVPMSGVFGGSSWATVTLASSAKHAGWPAVIDAKDLMTATANWGSISWLLPTPEVFGLDRVFVVTPSRNYTVGDFGVLLAKTNPPAGKVFGDVRQNYTGMPAPGIRTYCVHGADIPTLDIAVFDNDSLSGTMANTTVPGDGTVVAASLEVCSGWAKTQPQPVTSVVIPGMSHDLPVRTPEVIKLIVQWLGLPTAS